MTVLLRLQVLYGIQSNLSQFRCLIVLPIIKVMSSVYIFCYNKVSCNDVVLSSFSHEPK